MVSRTEIPLNKIQTVFLMLGALLFVIAGVFFMIESSRFLTTTHRSVWMIKAVGLASVLFFGLCLVFLAKSLFESKPGLIIDEYGITDNSSASSVGLIEWKDIEFIETIQVAFTQFVMVHTVQPEKYLNKARNGLMRAAMQANFNRYGSPVAISVFTLNIGSQYLQRLLQEALEKSRSQG